MHCLETVLDTTGCSYSRGYRILGIRAGLERGRPAAKFGDDLLNDKVNAALARLSALLAGCGAPITQDCATTVKRNPYGGCVRLVRLRVAAGLRGVIEGQRGGFKGGIHVARHRIWLNNLVASRRWIYEAMECTGWIKKFPFFFFGKSRGKFYM